MVGFENDFVIASEGDILLLPVEVSVSSLNVVVNASVYTAPGTAEGNLTVFKLIQCC